MFEPVKTELLEPLEDAGEVKMTAGERMNHVVWITQDDTDYKPEDVKYEPEVVEEYTKDWITVEDNLETQGIIHYFVNL